MVNIIHMAILHFWEHHLDALDHKIREFTEQYGAKWGILEYLRSFPELSRYIHPGFHITAETLQSGDFPDLPSEWKDIPLLYRSSHPDDHRGFIGRLPTLDSSQEVPDRRYNNLSHWELELFQIYRALAYYQTHKEEPKWEYRLVGFDGYNYPIISSRPRMVLNERNEIDYTDEPTPYDIYQRLLKEIQEEKTSVDYQKEVDALLWKDKSQYLRVLETMRERIRWAYGHRGERNIRDVRETHVYIQPKDVPTGRARWSVFESPHKPWVFVISYSTPSIQSEWERMSGYESMYSDRPETIMYDTNTWEISEVNKSGTLWDGYYENWMKKIIELYKIVKTKDIFWKDYSFEMEFGHSPNGDPRIYQIRQYSPFQHASFSLESTEWARRWLIRGITDATGASVRVIIHSLWRKFTPDKHDGQVMKIIHKNGHFYPNPGVPLDTMKFVGTTWESGLDSDHMLMTLLYETWWVATAGGVKLPNQYSILSEPWEYNIHFVSDGNSLLVDSIEQIS